MAEPSSLCAGSSRSAMRGLFAAIAPAYDLLNHTLSLGLDIYWRGTAIRRLANAPPGPFLDLAAGTFDLSISIASAYPGRLILAGDICLPMLQRGLNKISRAASKKQPFGRIRPLNADAYNLPLPDNSLAAITVAFGLRNMLPRRPALSEMLRVLKPGGRLLILELSPVQRKIWGGLYNLYLDKFLPRLGGLLSGKPEAYNYLVRSIKNFPPAEKLAEEMRQAGFIATDYQPLSGGIVYAHNALKP
ncbi:MAG: ubiquinone/menaquinone biosynthesis methyltransferase [Deltaproteobacteria bacterium]|jgi:demethylmenaquinone methyltransferase/2-methoxy-6-polyprenyl-1,4-benzoquinol methylase|nr:ubiquinone/menaquinone biosynthesis methyltransferase [Deltaproteobacteria bacterium]